VQERCRERFSVPPRRIERLSTASEAAALSKELFKSITPWTSSHPWLELFKHKILGAERIRRPMTKFSLDRTPGHDRLP
jgi:hypothetical protein